MPLPDDASRIDRQSPFPFDITVERLSQAITDAGMQIFAQIDHAANAREAGLSMPPSTVLIYGKAAGGTPIMLEHPLSALDLPLHVLVCRDSDGQTIVSFHPVGLLMAAAGVPASLSARLQPAQDLLLKALA
jgi:uncharacterized protein (DUF302 family)